MTDIQPKSLVSVRLVTAMLCLAACADAHLRGGTSTETGNPPAIESALVAKVISKSAVHIVGKPGAVSPGSIEVEVTNLATGKTQTATVEKDGSFDLIVSGSPNDAYEVSAVDGKKRSEPVYAVVGVATVGEGKNSELSCAQRIALAGKQIGQTSTNADRQCETVADCRFASTYTTCSACAQIAVSTAGVGEIESVVGAIEQGLCASFEEDGCALANDCDKGRRIAACFNGACVDETTGGASCQERIDLAGQQIASAVDGADRTCTIAADCALAPTGASCHAPCADAVVSKAGKADIDAAIAAVEQDVCGSFVADGCRVDPTPCPNRPTLPLICVAGQCEQAGECPPNAKFLADWCTACGPTGGCVNGGEPGCAIVCGSNADCAGVADPAHGCSARGVCEAFACL